MTTPQRSRVSAYLDPALYADSRAAYLADWADGGGADTYGAWVGAAIIHLAQHRPQDRAEAVRPRPRQSTSRGIIRSFNVPAQAVTAMQHAISADQDAGTWPTESGWVGAAIAQAVETSRARDGHLPPPPERLPTKLTRQNRA